MKQHTNSMLRCLTSTGNPIVEIYLYNGISYNQQLTGYVVFVLFHLPLVKYPSTWWGWVKPYCVQDSLLVFTNVEYFSDESEPWAKLLVLYSYPPMIRKTCLKIKMSGNSVPQTQKRDTFVEKLIIAESQDWSTCPTIIYICHCSGNAYFWWIMFWILVKFR